MTGRRLVVCFLLGLLVLVPSHAVAGAARGTAKQESSVTPVQVVSTDPTGLSLNISVHTSISVTFDRPILPGSITTLTQRFSVFGRWSGPAGGSFALSADNYTVTLVPDDPFFAGEMVVVILSDAIEAMDGNLLRPGGYSFSFWTHARRAAMQFAEIASLDCRTNAIQSTRAYGAIGSDLNNDGYSDLTVVQEDTADLRVFLNTADGSGHFDSFITPTFPVGERASPSEPADFNADGNVDICVANINVNSVSILLGTGDGKFGQQTLIPVGIAPRGIAVLDVDGDGDVDIVNTNSQSNNLSLIRNLGGGNFAAASFFEGGGTGEWSLAASDMNNDGIMDLIVGARISQRMIVLLGNGDSTFSFASSTPCGGRTWMIVAGDVNGDGNEDIVSANSSSANAAVMLGDGLGGLGTASIYNVGGFPLATDLGDLDGDGDLDWTISSFSPGYWRIFTNSGSGVFSTFRTVSAPEAGSCTVLHDVDNDGDTDISFIDEIEDVVLIYQNSGLAIFGDYDGDGSVNLTDYARFVECTGSIKGRPDCEVFDSDSDRIVDLVDFGALQIAFE